MMSMSTASMPGVFSRTWNAWRPVSARRAWLVMLRQVERERAALAHRARHANFATQHSDDLAADGQAQAGTAVHARGAPVRLLERLEDQLELVASDADSHVRDRERQ